MYMEKNARVPFAALRYELLNPGGAV